MSRNGPSDDDIESRKLFIRRIMYVMVILIAVGLGWWFVSFMSSLLTPAGENRYQNLEKYE